MHVCFLFFSFFLGQHMFVLVLYVHVCTCIIHTHSSTCNTHTVTCNVQVQVHICKSEKKLSVGEFFQPPNLDLITPEC